MYSLSSSSVFFKISFHRNSDLANACGMGIVIGWPLIRTVIYSFTDAQLLEIQPARSVGLDNYVKAFAHLELF